MKLEELPPLLAPLGFTETEALVYGELLSRPDQTGYGLAKAIRKGQPVTYAALSGLEAKGAVMSSLAPARVYRAVPPGELIAALKADFQRKCQQAETSLETPIAGSSTDQIYHLRSTEQVLERARRMLAQARSTVLFELFPFPLNALRGDLTAAASRDGVAAVGMVLRSEDQVEGARSLIPANASQIREVWDSEVLTLIVDAEQALVATFSDERVVQGYWTDSLYLAVLLHNAISADVVLHERGGPDWKGPNLHLFGKRPPGLVALNRVSERP